MRTTKRRVAALGCALGLLLGASVMTGTAQAQNPPAKPVTVMTRNIYLGADIQRPIEAALLAAAQPGANQLTIVTALAHATHVSRAVVDDTDFRVRGRLLADEIADAQPDLVGLQEVALWRHGPLQLSQVGVPNADVVDYDFLQILLADLAQRGASYVAVSVANRADVESPSFTGPITAPGGDPRDIRLTMRDVILMRASGSLTELDEGQAIYRTNLSFRLPTLPPESPSFDFDRGYQWVDVRAGAQRFRFVNTHLEAFSSDIALAQAGQLLAEATSPTRSTVFVCDCNSDPANSSVKPGDHVAHQAPYQLITGAGGYTDLWLASGRPADLPGFDAGDTSGLNETVDEGLPGSWTHRIDMVFGRTADGGELTTDRGAVTGRDGDPRDPATGLWPSDHAGVVMRVRGL
jgi:endonuclease/exonuclease/phosphatase family metal-dependent hydrolase